VTGMSVTIQATGRPVLLLFSAEYQNDTGVVQQPRPTFRRDGTAIATMSGPIAFSGETATVVGLFVDQAPPPGSRTYAPYWDGSGDGSGSSFLVGGDAEIQFSVYEL
jgi:hypothetical protein